MTRQASRRRPLLFLLLLTMLSALWLAHRRPTTASTAAPVASSLPADHPALPPQPAARVATTSQDFFLPGSQAGSIPPMPDPLFCGNGCHLNYDDASPEIETLRAWSGSMMAQSARDPVFYAALDVANADAAAVGEWCLRCHAPRAWYGGRTTADGSALEGADFAGVQCETCHWMVDPFYEAGNPDPDPAILAAIDPPLATVGSGALILDPEDRRRGPFDIAADWEAAFGVVDFNPHLGTLETLPSPYHRDAALCGSCHDISNPAFSWDDQSGSYQPNDLDAPGDPADGFPIERTYTEWLLSDYNTPAGIYAPALGGNQPYVSTCQDCHLRATTGAAAQYPFNGRQLVRDDMPLHDLTGANTWVPQLLPLHPEFGDDYQTWELDAIAAGALRARYMLENAATLNVEITGRTLTVTVTNETGHKLPTGYPEGRRMWIQVEGYSAGGQLVYTSGAYDVATGELGEDPDLRLYESKQGLTADWAAQLGLDAGPSFHFALNNVVVSDNRIPPRGYDFAAFAAAGAAPMTDGQPDAARYVQGQYWDTAIYTLPQGVASGHVRLLYQTASREYVEFLRDNNPDPANPDNRGALLYDLWTDTDRSAPVTMAERSFGLPTVFVPALVIQ